MIYAALGAVFISVIMWVMGRRFAPAWEKREMDNLAGKWNRFFLMGSILAVAGAAGAVALGAPFLGAVALSVILWLIPLVTATDYTTLLIPREISVLAYYLPLPLFALYAWQQGSWTPVINLALWMGAVALFLIPVMMGRMGFGDLRLFILFGTALAWWAGAYYVVLGLLVASILQTVLFIIASATKKIGVYRVVTPLTDEADTLETTESPAPGIGRHKAADAVSEGNSSPQKKRLFLPFGPALLYGASLAGFAAAYLPYEELIDLLIM